MLHFHGTFGQGIMLANVVWFIFHMGHRVNHCCMPKDRMFRVDEAGNEVYYRSPKKVIKEYLGFNPLN